MGIKYHQYGCGNDYGDDHYLTDNWNPDYDYGSQYVEVYFNINTPSYMHDKDPSAFGFAMKDCEIANILYNLSTDMDADDYADIYDIEVQEIEKSIYKLKESHDILYPVLVSIAETHKDMFDFCKDQN